MKEIVITNKNGITLPTKKTLVNDDIKIKLDNSIKAIDGVSETDTGIVLVETPKEKPITIKGDHNEINVTQGSVKLNLNAYAEITLADNSEMNSIVTENLEPDNIKKDVTILGVTGTFEGGSDKSQEDGLIDKTLTSYSNDRITMVGEYAFIYQRNLQYVNIPNAISLRRSVFAYCSSLHTIKLGKVNEINGNGILQGCNALDLYLGYEGVVNISSTSVFNPSPSGVKVHVRSEFADQYATATNWASLIANGTIVIVGDYSD